MYLHRLHLNPRCREVRRDIADPYEMHSTLCRAFSPSPEQKCLPGSFLWRLEPEQSHDGFSKVIVQSHLLPDWSRINLTDWLGEAPAMPIKIFEKLSFDKHSDDSRFRYRLRANPSVCRKGKRLGLLNATEQMDWFIKHGDKNGFKPFSIHMSEGRMLTGNIRKNTLSSPIRLFSILYDGILTITDIQQFQKAIESGIGRGKSMGLGLLSVAPIQ